MNFLKKITVKHLGIYLVAAFIFNQILFRWLGNSLMDFLQGLYISLPTVLQNLLYPISGSLELLEPTTIELSVLFAVSAVENMGKLVEISMIIVLIWLIGKGIASMRRTSNTKINPKY